jgi:TolB-like protein/Tfp pilus assembly protein PilF/DNA-binding winged helix-turn-helix (wHTH) protein
MGDRIYRFGKFELLASVGELRTKDACVRLQEKPLLLLTVLVENPQRLVTRAQLRERMWDSETFVDYELGINVAIKKLRDALGDSAENPTFIQTVAKKGYRFLVPVEVISPELAAPGSSASDIVINSPALPHATPSPKHPVRRRWLFAALATGVLSALGLWGFEFRPHWPFSDVPKKISSLAVLPLEDLSPDRSQEYLSEGLTDELITDLAKIPSLRIISRTTTMQYKGTHKPLPEIARELNVDALVEGTMLRSGNRLRIRVQLIQASTDQHLWAEAYDRDVNDVLALQSEVASSIAGQIKLEVAPQQQAKASAARAVNFDAYSAYLKGRYEWNKRTAEDLKKSIQYFQEAIERDPGYAEGHEGLAEAYSVLSEYDVLAPGESYPKARAEAVKALELDPSLSEAHATVATVKEEYEWDWPGAGREFQLAVELGPGSATAHQWYGEYLLRVGRIEEGLAQMRQALQLDPGSPLMNAELGGDLYWARQYDQAIQQLRKAIEMEPRFAYAHSWLGFAYEQKGMRKEAIEEFQKAVALSGGSGFRAALGYAYGRAGRATEARKISDDLTRRATQVYVSPYDMAVLYVGLGEKEQALKSLERAFAVREPALDLLKIEPALDPLRTDPRFSLLVRRVGLAP